MTENTLHKIPCSLGTLVEGDNVRFSYVSKTDNCGVLLYDRKTGALLRKIPFSEDDRIGNVYCRTVENVDVERSTYLFYEGERLIPDERAQFFPQKVPYGKERRTKDMKAGFETGGFDWDGDRRPCLPYNNVIVYCMHVRGFTKHASSNVKNKGTFAGIVEKIPYLKEIGVTTIELQPAYEFIEVPAREERERVPLYGVLPDGTEDSRGKVLNYWGYQKGYYYVPKAAYAASEDAPREFRELVRALHENGMELVMQFYFSAEVKRSEISDILRFWVIKYHVDGFHLLGENLPADMLAADDMLADTKLWYYQFDTERIYGRNEAPRYPHEAEYNDTWYYDMRRFLKGDANMLGSALYHMRHIPEKSGHIHYLSNYYGFTLFDLVSYDYKHNEENGEENRDGSDNNCSWNCGEEGPARRQTVRRLRLKQIKNAMALLMLSHSTPLIFMGDEIGNSQKGNNNPYCQDNAVTWLDWNGIKKNEELLAFWKSLVDFRKKHPILRPKRELRLMDDKSCGYPDLSYHGHNAWRPQTDGNFRQIGIMLCGKYAEGGDDAFLYLAVNMHWEGHELALPKLPRGMKWEEALATEREECVKRKAEKESCELRRYIPPRSITVFIGVLA